MYQPRHFEVRDREAMLALVAAYPLATLVMSTDDGLQANHIPLYAHLDEAGDLQLHGHVARANPLCRNGLADREVLAVFNGPQAYVTPSWYPGKHEHGKAVPTWNYTVVHAHGSLRVHDDKNWLRAQVDELTKRHERTRDPAWSIDEAPADYLDAMLGAIVGIELRVSRLEGKFKLSQNQSAANKAGVLAGLSAEAAAPARAVADAMRSITLNSTLS